MSRVLDVALAGTALIVGAPLLAALAVAVVVETRGPALFVQTRVGRGKRPIRIAKLRTMAVSSAGPSITAGGDPRVTRVGALLRRTKLDELPQLWSVLRGDMSLVGPRPEVEQYVALYRPEWQRLFAVRPGLTDRASITFRDEESLLMMAHDRERAYKEVVMPLKLELALAGLEDDALHVIGRTVLALLRRDAHLDPVIVEAQRRIAALNAEAAS